MATTSRGRRLSFLDQLREDFAIRHDPLSRTKQRAIANLLLIGDLTLMVASVTAVLVWGWRPVVGPGELAVLSGLLFVSVTCLIAASGLLIRIGILFRNLGSGDVYIGAETDNPVLARYRRYFYWIGVYFQFLAVAVTITFTGGLVSSPFTPVLLAMVITGQQLGRFVLNSWLMFGTGTLIVLSLYLVEIGGSGVNLTSGDPLELNFTIMLLSFLLSAVLTHHEKGPNFHARRKYPAPTRIVVRKTPPSRERGPRAWRYCLYSKSHQIDMVLPIPGVDESASLTAAKTSAEALIDSSAYPLGLDDPCIEWVHTQYPDSASDEAVGIIVQNSPAQGMDDWKEPRRRGRKLFLLVLMSAALALAVITACWAVVGYLVALNG